ncbi:MmcQ/YjbR family DNA-binding protein [Edaphocola aurantiacus]|uniref:MmcQ/YjbR family DNA-binding protein n=1 Tax=Edaphocola aurantiacus TaxID=2601682 RepID=UPI001C96DA0E|nr:MmcQ/YjbR family DNA-binding protein [Edaphocola aurantiacus]
MDIESIRSFCLSQENVTESFPFGEETLVFKANEKIFLLLALDEQPARINVKCDPDRAIELRESCSSVLPGYHMNKKHWNTIIMDGALDNAAVKSEILHSYHLVTAKKSKPKKS